MPRTPNTPEEAQKQETVDLASLPTMTNDSLLTIIATMQKQLMEAQKQQAEANQALADAILKSREPYEDPRKKQNEAMFKKRDTEIELRKKLTIKYAQDSCEHIAGSNPLSEQKDIAGRTSIVWHRGDVGQVFGVCTVCGRIFKEDDPDFALWRRKKSFNRESASGFRTVFDPIKARRDAFLRDEEPAGVV